MKNLLATISGNRFGTFLAIICLSYAGYVIYQFTSGAYLNEKHEFTRSRPAMAHILFWALAPPLYFFIEYYWTSPDRRKAVKEGQELASRVWAAVLVVILFAIGK